MTLLTRLSRLFRADFHAVLDCIEEPAAVLEQAVREMDESVLSDEQRLTLLAHELEQLAARRQACIRHLAQISDELDVCFAAGNEDLARGLLKRRLESEKLDQYLVGQAETIGRVRQQLKQRIEEHRISLEAMRQKLALLADADTAGGAATRVSARGIVRDEDVEIALLREKQRRAQA